MLAEPSLVATKICCINFRSTGTSASFPFPRLMKPHTCCLWGTQSFFRCWVILATFYIPRICFHSFKYWQQVWRLNVYDFSLSPLFCFCFFFFLLSLISVKIVLRLKWQGKITGSWYLATSSTKFCNRVIATFNKLTWRSHSSRKEKEGSQDIVVNGAKRGSPSAC